MIKCLQHVLQRVYTTSMEDLPIDDYVEIFRPEFILVGYRKKLRSFDYVCGTFDCKRAC